MEKPRLIPADYLRDNPFAEKNKLLRVKIPLPAGFEGARAVGDGSFVIENKPNTECVFQKWFGVQREDCKIFAIVNDGVYAGKVENGYIYLTLLRGAGYCFHPINDKELYPQDRIYPKLTGAGTRSISVW
jgi:alpha-mannosidase